jgi:glycosyltransferase involved in cell wall biosynthesis
MKFNGRLALQQRVLPEYRVPFFDALAGACNGGLSIFAGKPLPSENIRTSTGLKVAHYYPAENRHFMNPASPFYQCRQEGILEWLEAWDPQALIIEANSRYPNTQKAIRWMHERKRPVIGWGLGAPPARGILGYWKEHRRWNLLHALDAVIAYSQRGREEYISLGLHREYVYVAYNAANPRPPHPAPQRPSSFLGKPSVLFVGRLQSRKRIDNLLYACAKLPSSLQPQLLIVGDGPAREYFQSVASRAYPSAKFLGARYGEALNTLFTSADLFVLPGSGGLAVQQAMSYALPVIVADGDGTQEDLVSENNGWLIPANDIDALIEALLKALSDPARLRSMGKASFRIVSEKINIEEMVKVFIKALSTTISVTKDSHLS